MNIFKVVFTLSSLAKSLLDTHQETSSQQIWIPSQHRDHLTFSDPTATDSKDFLTTASDDINLVKLLCQRIPLVLANEGGSSSLSSAEMADEEEGEKERMTEEEVGMLFWALGGLAIGYLGPASDHADNPNAHVLGTTDNFIPLKICFFVKGYSGCYMSCATCMYVAGKRERKRDR